MMPRVSELQWERRSPRSPSPFFVTVLAFERRSADSERPTSVCRLVNCPFFPRRMYRLSPSRGSINSRGMDHLLWSLNATFPDPFRRREQELANRSRSEFPAVKNSLNPTCKLKQHCASFIKRRCSMMVLSQGTGTCATSPPQLIGSIIGFASVLSPAQFQAMQIFLALNTLTSPRQLGGL